MVWSSASTEEQLNNQLFLAAQRGNLEKVKLLLYKVKKPISLSNPEFIVTAHSLINCRYRSENQLATLKLLTANGVDFNYPHPQRDGLYINSWCKKNQEAFNQSEIPAQQNTVDIAKFLIQQGANAKKLHRVRPKHTGRSSLASAISNDNEPLAIYLSKYSDITEESMKMAMHHGMDKLISTLITSDFDYSDHDLLRWSIRDFNGTYHEEVLINLLNDGLDPNKFIVEQRYYHHPIILAVYKNNLSAIKTLRLYGAQIEVTDKKGRSLLDIAKRQKHTEIVEYLDNN